MADGAQPLGTWLRLAAGGAAALVAALTVVPLGAVLARAGGVVMLGPADWAAVRFTLLQSTLSAAISLALAIPVARALARRQFPGRGLLITLLGAPFILPVVVAVMGILAIFGRGGLFNDGVAALGYGRISIYGLGGVVLAHVFFNLPLAVRLLLQGWLAIPAERFRLAAALGFGPAEVARHLERPMLKALAPGIFATVFLLCLTSFATALILGGGPRATTVELAIYQAFRFDFDLARAAALASLQLALCAVTALAAARFAVPAAFGTGLDRPFARWDAQGSARRWLDAGLIGIPALFLLAPLAAVVLSGMPGLVSLPAPVWKAAGRSALVAATSTGLTLALALPMALAVARSGRARTLEAAGMLPLATSALVTGTGLFLILRPLASPAALALPVTVAVNAVMALPFALRSLTPPARDLEAGYGRLAQSLGLTGLARLRLLTLPRLRRPLGFAAGLTAALSMGDLGVIALFADSDRATLPLELYRLMGAYRMEDAAGAAVLLLALSLAAFWLLDRGVAPMLELDRLVITQDDFRLAADFSIPKAARVAVIGPSGAGKSTLLSVISGFFRPESGRIRWDGQDITDTAPGLRPLSILFQDQNLFPHLTVSQNVGLGLRPDLRLTAADRARVDEALARTGLDGLGDRRPGTLSGGQQSRVALARVLLRARPLMLLDEPFAALGPALKDEMLELVADIAGETGATVLMVSHDPADALRFAGLTVLVADGVAHAPRPTAALMADPPEELAAYLGRPG